MRAPVHAPSHASAELQALHKALAVVVCGTDGTILRANANFLQLTGFKARELIGQPRATLVGPAASDGVQDAETWAAVCRGEARDVEFPWLRKDASLMWVRAIHTPVIGSDGQVSEIVIFVSDITAAKQRAADDRGQIIAINSAQAVIHFALDGTILMANERFLATMGVTHDEIVGQHHRRFVEPSEAASEDYRQFWDDLVAGRHRAGVFRRLAKDGREVWMQAAYNPILDINGEVAKIVKYATDVTADMMRQADHEGQIDAIRKSHGVITFDMNGTVLHANDIFLQAVGYRLEEIEGRHHRMFVDPSYAHGPEYAAFWNTLAEGRHQAGEYKRVGKNGREVWLQASYNPIHDLNGKAIKVVKYATIITREKLRQADHQGQIASIHKAQCVISFDLDGTVLDANDNFLDATGYRLSEVRGRHHRLFVDPATAASDEYREFWAELARGVHKSAEFKRVRKDGQDIWLQASYNPIFDMNGRPFKVVKYATDITQERLRQADNEGQIAAIQKSQCVAAFDMNGIIVDANDRFLEAMGYERHEIVGRHHRTFVDAAFAASDEYREFWDTLRAGKYLSEKFRRVGKGGREVWIQASYNPILDLNGKPFKVIKIATDVTADVALAADFVDARRQAEHDVATALPNRVGLTQFMRSALDKPDSRLAVLYLDLDHFKPINDTFGHHVGDIVLKETARRLTEVVGPDQIVARIGGDEFVVAAPDLSDDQIDGLCQRLIGIVQAPIRHEKALLKVGLSIGVAVSPQDAFSAPDLLRCADVALYRTKGNGRGSYSYFAADMEQRLSTSRNMAQEMLHGIKASQFFLEFRPRVSALDRRLESIEASVCWKHPTQGCLRAGEFMSLAEKSGLVMPIGEWALKAACEAAATWKGIGVSLLVSPVQFFGTDFPKLVEGVLQASKLAPERLELEMSDQLLADDAGRTRDALQALRAMGVKLTLEDLGDHHGSLSELREIGFDTVRIDRRFVADIEAEIGEPALIREIHRLGDALAAPVKIGALHTEDQLIQLALGDKLATRGYHLTTTMLPAELAGLLARLEAEGEKEAAV